MNERLGNPSPEIIDPTIIDSIVATATDAVDRYGDGHAIDLAAPHITSKTATFSLRGHAVEGMAAGVIPRLSIGIPVGEYAETSPNRVSINLSYKDEGLLGNYVVRKNNTIGNTRPRGEEPRDLNNQEASALNDLLTTLVGQVAQDYIDPFSDLPTTEDPRS